MEKKTKGRKKFTFSMTTNGTLLDRHKMEFIKKHFRSEHPFLLSIDGPEHVHNLHRKTTAGIGSYDMIPLDLIEEFYKFKGIEVRPTYTTDMFPTGVLDSLKWLYRKGFRKIPIEWDYDAKWTDENLEKFKQTVESVNNLWWETVSKLKDPFAKPKSIGEIEKLFFVKNEIPKGFLCGRGFNSMGIDSQGGIWPCQRWAGYTEKNAEDYKLGDVFEGVNLNKLYIIQNINRKRMLPPEGMNCDVCEFRSSCQGGCNASLWQKYGSRFQLDIDYCKIKRTIFEVTMKWIFKTNYYHYQILPKLLKKKQLFDEQIIGSRKPKQVSVDPKDCRKCYTCENNFS